MKKYIKTFLFTSFIVAFISCEGPMGPMGPAGRDGQDGEDGWANFFVGYYTISSASWSLSEGETFFYADVDCPELTDFVYNEGVVMGYYMLDFDTDYEVQIPLPFDIYFNEDDESWTETISFDFVTGGIRFYYEPSDFYTDFTVPTSTFKVALMW